MMDNMCVGEERGEERREERGERREERGERYLVEELVAHAALNDARYLVRSLHDLLPGLVDVLETLGFLKQTQHICPSVCSIHRLRCRSI